MRLADLTSEYRRVYSVELPELLPYPNNSLIRWLEAQAARPWWRRWLDALRDRVNYLRYRLRRGSR